MLHLYSLSVYVDTCYIMLHVWLLPRHLGSQLPWCHFTQPRLNHAAQRSWSDLFDSCNSLAARQDTTVELLVWNCGTGTSSWIFTFLRSQSVCTWASVILARCYIFIASGLCLHMLHHTTCMAASKTLRFTATMVSFHSAQIESCSPTFLVRLVWLLQLPSFQTRYNFATANLKLWCSNIVLNLWVLG